MGSTSSCSRNSTCNEAAAGTCAVLVSHGAAAGHKLGCCVIASLDACCWPARETHHLVIEREQGVACSTTPLLPTHACHLPSGPVLPCSAFLLGLKIDPYSGTCVPIYAPESYEIKHALIKRSTVSGWGASPLELCAASTCCPCVLGYGPKPRSGTSRLTNVCS